MKYINGKAKNGVFSQLPAQPQERALWGGPHKSAGVGRIGFSRDQKHHLIGSLRCCIEGGAGVDAGACASTGGTLVEAMREAQPYCVAHRGSTFVVVLSTQIIDSPHLSSILEVCVSHFISFHFLCFILLLFIYFNIDI